MSEEYEGSPEWLEGFKAFWGRMGLSWRRTYEKHHSSSGWATLGAEVKDGVCSCACCWAVRKHGELVANGKME